MCVELMSEQMNGLKERLPTVETGSSDYILAPEKPCLGVGESTFYAVIYILLILISKKLKSHILHLLPVSELFLRINKT